MSLHDTDETRVETLTAALLYLMTHLRGGRRTGASRDICGSLHGAWAAAPAQEDGAKLH